ncbi:MAG: dihydroneopterin aldolase [Burkholderiaceae bacterium]|jgi:dihydroneopterin aldolase|nr:dihydroneopterin aldolase [Burkholderiaceae bacterium]
MMLLDPRLTDCRRIFLQDFAVSASIGFHDFEKKTAQRILISVDLFVPISASTSSNDQVDDVLDYDFLRHGIESLAQSRHFNLQETLIDQICALCLGQPGVRAVRVESQKPDVYPDCKTVGVEVFRWGA